MQYTIKYRPTFVMLDFKGVALVYSISTCPSNNTSQTLHKGEREKLHAHTIEAPTLRTSTKSVIFET
jgi:hypothetical protein